MNDTQFDEWVALSQDWDRLRTYLRFHQGATVAADAVLDHMDALELLRIADLRKRSERRPAS